MHFDTAGRVRDPPAAAPVFTSCLFPCARLQNGDTNFATLFEHQRRDQFAAHHHLQEQYHRISFGPAKRRLCFCAPLILAAPIAPNAAIRTPHSAFQIPISAFRIPASHIRNPNSQLFPARLPSLLAAKQRMPAAWGASPTPSTHDPPSRNAATHAAIIPQADTECPRRRPVNLPIYSLINRSCVLTTCTRGNSFALFAPLSPNLRTVGPSLCS